MNGRRFTCVRDRENARGEGGRVEDARAISHGKLNGQVSAHKAKRYDGIARFRETLSAQLGSTMKSNVTL